MSRKSFSLSFVISLACAVLLAACTPIEAQRLHTTPATFVYSTPCPLGKNVRGMENDGSYLCCPVDADSKSPACSHESFAEGDCLPSGYPTGQPNDAQFPNNVVTITSCGQASGSAMNCCSHQASWQNYEGNIDPWGTLTRHGHPLDGTWYECLCR